MGLDNTIHRDAHLFLMFSGTQNCRRGNVSRMETRELGGEVYVFSPPKGWAETRVLGPRCPTSSLRFSERGKQMLPPMQLSLIHLIFSQPRRRRTSVTDVKESDHQYLKSIRARIIGTRSLPMRLPPWAEPSSRFDSC